MNKFKSLRSKLGVSQEECARELGVSTASVVTYEREAPKHIIDKMTELLTKSDKQS